jgi:hypothetical protein
LRAISAIQGQISAVRESFATGLLEGAILSGLSAATADFEKNSGALLQGLETGLSEALQAHSRAAEAMADYRRSSIEALRADPPCDAWLLEHRYRRAVETLRERQRAFTAKLCCAVEEVFRLEELREENTRKALSLFCTKLHQVETAVQSLANDGIRALAGHKKEDSPSVAILMDLEQLLQKAPAQYVSAAVVVASQTPTPAAVPGAKAAPKARPKPGEWPALLQLRDQGRLDQLPASILSVMSGCLKSPRRWSASQLSMVVLTKDFWLHSFAITPPKAGAARSSGESSLEAVEAEPAWSLYLPNTSVTTQKDGKTRCIEVEEAKRGLFGIKNTRREILQADDDTTLQRWVTTLQLGTQKTLFGPASSGRAEPQATAPRQPPPPPPPPPPPALSTSPDKVATSTSISRSSTSSQATPERRGQAQQPVSPEMPAESVFD